MADASSFPSIFGHEIGAINQPQTASEMTETHDSTYTISPILMWANMLFVIVLVGEAQQRLQSPVAIVTRGKAE